MLTILLYIELLRTLGKSDPIVLMAFQVLH